jgi:hypothetical protein
MPISGNQWRWTAGAFHSAIVASPIWQDHSDDARTAHGIHAEQPDSCRSRPAARGQQATFTDGSRVFELNVRNREANQALPGQNRKLTG